MMNFELQTNYAEQFLPLRRTDYPYTVLINDYISKMLTLINISLFF